MRPLLQVLFAAYMEYTKVANDAHDLGELGVVGMGIDPFEDCPACAKGERAELTIGAKGAACAAWLGQGATLTIVYRPAGGQCWSD